MAEGAKERPLDQLPDLDDTQLDEIAVTEMEDRIDRQNGDLDLKLVEESCDSPPSPDSRSLCVLPDLTEHISMGPLIYEVFSTSSKSFELSLKPKSSQSGSNSELTSKENWNMIQDEEIELCFLGCRSPPAQLLFAPERLGDFQPTFTTLIDKEGRNKVFLQILVDPIKYETEVQTQLEIRRTGSNSVQFVPVLIKVASCSHSDLFALYKLNKDAPNGVWT